MTTVCRETFPTFCLAWCSAVLVAAGCTGGTQLEGDGADASEADEAPPDVEDVPGFEDAPASEAEDGAAGDEAGDPGEDTVDDDAPCPVWTVPSATGDVETGTETHPFAGLRRALESRGDCELILLRPGGADAPFDAGVELALGDGESLTIAGDPASEQGVELDAHDDVGLFASGSGSLTLRHITVRRGRSDEGGCLNAMLAAVVLDDTEWTDCHAESGGAIWVWAARIRISDSIFLRNRAAGGWGGGALLDGPRDTTQVVVENCRFEENEGGEGGGLSVRARSEQVVVRHSVFSRNTGRLWGAALEGFIGELWHNRFESNGPGDSDQPTPAVDIDGTSDLRVWHNVFLENWTPTQSAALVHRYGTVHNNIFARNACGLPRSVGGCSGALHSWGGEVRNNTFVDNRSLDGPTHIVCQDPLGVCRSNLLVGGNGACAVGNDQPDVLLSAPMTYNAYWNVDEPIWCEAVVVGEGNVEADPRFADSDDTWRLGTASTCIDAGDPDPLLDDFDGTRNDVGAFGGPDGEWVPLSAAEVP